MAFCAFPATHLTVTERWLLHNEDYDDEQMRAVVLGTVYPDIRYLGEHSRSETHPADVTIQSIAEAETPFQQGVLLHVFLDDERWRLIQEWNVHALLDEAAPGLSPIDRDTFLKLVEDEILSENRMWLTVQRYLTIVIPEEIENGTSLHTALRWHMIVSRYLSDGPSNVFRQLALAGRGFLGRSPDLVAEWSTRLTEVAAHPNMRDYVDRLVDHFDALFQQ